MQYTYFGVGDDIPVPYMDNNNIFTNLILEYKFVEAVEMINNIKDLKFNGDLLNCCYNMEYLNHIGCDHEIKYVIGKIVLHNNYVDVIKLLQFLIPENIIFKDSCDNPNEDCECRRCYRKFSERCNKIVHNYSEYCALCIYHGYIDNARAIYITFPVDNSYILVPPYYLYTGKELNIFKTTYEMILQAQELIPLNRRGISNIDISLFVDIVYRKKILFDIIEWYYTINPISYTRGKMNKTLEKAKELKKIDLKQIIRLEKFFESIKIEFN